MKGGVKNRNRNLQNLIIIYIVFGFTCNNNNNNNNNNNLILILRAFSHGLTQLLRTRICSHILEYLPHCALIVGFFSIGLLSDNIKLAIKPYLQKESVSDEELFEALNVCVSNETERLQKLGSRLTPQVNAVHEAESAAGRVKDGSKANAVDYALLKEVRELKAEVAAVKEKVSSPPQVPLMQQPMSPFLQ